MYNISNSRKDTLQQTLIPPKPKTLNSPQLFALTQLEALDVNDKSFLENFRNLKDESSLIHS